MKITVVAPGRPLSHEAGEKVETLFANHFPQHSLSINPACYEQHNHFSAPDDRRAAHLQAALNDPQTDIVWLGKGGYGACRLLGRINWQNVPQHKIVAGYSDGGFILATLAAHGQGHAVHAPMCGDILRSGGEALMIQTVEHLARLVEGVAVPAIFSLPGASAAEVTGRPVVLNLSVLTKLIGTPFMPDLSSRILIMEDVGEHAYAIDRMLFQLAHCAAVMKAKAVVLGGFTDIPVNDVEFGETVPQMAQRWFGEKMPVYWGFPAEHGVNNTVVSFQHVLTIRPKP